MRVAIASAVPGKVLVDKAAWLAAGFVEAGHEVRRCHTLDDVRRADAECDLLVLDQHGAGMSHISLAEMARGRRARWAQVWRDLVHCYADQSLEKQPDFPVFIGLWRALDLVCFKERAVIAEIEHRHGVKAAQLDQACPSNIATVRHPAAPEWDALVFGGTAAVYENRRADALALVQAGYRVLWATNASVPVPPGVEPHPWVEPLRELPKLASRCAVVLGVDWRETPGYTSDRSYLAGGMGACYVARVDLSGYGSEWGVSQARAIAPALHGASWGYETTEELLDCLRRAINDRDERQRRGQDARRRIMAGHTYRHRAEELVQAVKAETLGLEFRRTTGAKRCRI